MDLSYSIVYGSFTRWLYFPTYLFNASQTLRRIPSFRKLILQIQGPQVWLQETFIQQSDWWASYFPNYFEAVKPMQGNSCVFSALRTLVLFSLVRLCAIAQPFQWQWIHEAQTARKFIIVLSGLSALFTSNNVVKLSYLQSHNISLTKAPSWLVNWSETQHEAEVSTGSSSIICTETWKTLITNWWLLHVIFVGGRNALESWAFSDH